MKIKTLVTAITLSRIVGAISLLWVEPLSALFYKIYAFCIASDLIDGPLARKTNTASKSGATLDSIADAVFMLMVLFIVLPVLDLQIWMLYLVALVLAVRIVALLIGYKKYRLLSFLHTYSSKSAGLLMALFPLYYEFWGVTVMFIIVFIAAFVSALDELIITIYSKEYAGNTPGMFGIFFKKRDK